MALCVRKTGYFQILAASVTGPWMNTVYFLGSQVSLYGLYNSASKNGLFEPFVYKCDHFTKTGSGQTYGKLNHKNRFVSGEDGGWRGEAAITNATQEYLLRPILA